MEARLALRSARHLAGLSQRALAERAGVLPSLVAALESGARPARWDTVVALLDACGLGLALVERQEEQEASELAAYLRLSSSARLYWSLGGRLSWRSRSSCPVWQELGRLSRCAVVGLPPAAGVGVWLPDIAAPAPLPVLASARPGKSLPQALELLELAGPAPARRGMVPVGVTAEHEVFVLPPLAPALQGDPSTAARLRLAARLLLDGEARDEQGRSRAAHRSARMDREQSWVMARRRFSAKELEPPDARDRRDWRLGGDASFRAWLLRQGFPIDRYGHRERGP